ncbi:MAG: cytochrome c3 family protein [Thermodesulfobacteriota bacterium]
MRANLASLAVAALLLLLGAGPLLAAEEAENQPLWSTSPYFYWQGKIEAGEGVFTCTVNDNRLEAGKCVGHIYQGVAHVRVTLTLEENAIVISRGGKELFRGSFFYAPSFNELLVPEDTPSYVFHTQEREDACKACHRMEPADGDKEPRRPQDSLCHSCHADEFARLKYRHVTTEQWRCLHCHNPEWVESETIPDTMVRYAVTEIGDLSVVCYGCHEKEQEKYSAEHHIHGPVAEGGCHYCHNPHGSARPKFIQTNVTRLCVDCHDLGEILERPFVHTILRKKGCTACHDAHASGFEYQLRMDVVPLCFSCHRQIEKVGDNHPLNRHPAHGKPYPNDKSKLITCVSCHNPHGSDADKLLPETEMMLLCVRCHDMKK